MSQFASPQTARRWLITGVSGGLGRALAEYALARGDLVAGTVRKPEQVEAFQALAPGRAIPLLLDVTDDAAVLRGVSEALEQLDGLDVLVNNAAHGLMGPAEDTELAAARLHVETNILGPLKTVQAVLPHFREQRYGHILNITSVAGVVCWPFRSLYTASKFALVGFSGSLSKELADFGVKVISIEVGAFRTDFAAKLIVPERASETYAGVAEQLKTQLTEYGKRAPNDPAKGAAVIASLLDLDDPPVHFALGADSHNMITASLRERLAEYQRFTELAGDTEYDR